ncbi:hypothetical protein QBD01_001170 [Ochrobactrum sp. 19YEA23]|nr:hypothetical protein [Ochrobactrum sp. 19YEA23]
MLTFKYENRAKKTKLELTISLGFVAGIIALVVKYWPM